MTGFKTLSRLKFLRGTALDPFGRSEERQAERRLIGEYEAMVDDLLKSLAPETLGTAVALASLPDKLRGFGHVKEKNLRQYETDRGRLLDKLRQPAVAQAAE
jgi:indolepyruvate ferredoxin oxidoreductase